LDDAAIQVAQSDEANRLLADNLAEATSKLSQTEVRYEEASRASRDVKTRQKNAEKELSESEVQLEDRK